MTNLLATMSGSLKSLTIWFNSVIGVALTIIPILQDTVPQLQDYMTPNAYKITVGILVIGNLLLRLKTTKPLSEK